MQTIYIDDTKELEKICKQFNQNNYLIIDTEFIRQTTYFPKLALLQVCDGKTIAIIDPIAVKDLSPLIALCFDDSIVKVLHSARQDLEIIFHICGKLPTPIFDTQIAAALLGYGAQVGYASLVKSYLNIDLDKSQTRTNWLARPLTEKQLTYAADDVRYLDEVYKLQKQELIDMNRLDWLENDFNFLTQQSTYLPNKLNLWKKIRGHNRLKRDQLAVLQALTAWREEIAIKKDLTRKKVIHDDFLLEIAIQKPTKYEQFHGFQCLSEYLVKLYGKQLIDIVNKALSLPEEQWPELPKFKKLSALQGAMADSLMAINHICADQNKISASCLCNRKEIEKMVQGNRELNILSGWRYELAGKQLLAFLNGENSLSVEHNKLSIQ